MSQLVLIQEPESCKAPPTLWDRMMSGERRTGPSRTGGLTKAQAKQRAREIRAVIGTQGFLGEMAPNRRRGKDLKRMELHTMTRLEWARLRVLDGKSPVELTEAGLAAALFHNRSEARARGAGERGELLALAERRAGALAQERGVWADEHDKCVRRALARGEAVEPGIAAEFHRRGSVEPWMFGIREFQELEKFGKRFSELTGADVERLWGKLAPMEDRRDAAGALITQGPAPMPESLEQALAVFAELIDFCVAVGEADGGDNPMFGKTVHRRSVEKALRTGLEVPRAAVSAYPGLAGRYAALIR